MQMTRGCIDITPRSLKTAMLTLQQADAVDLLVSKVYSCLPLGANSCALSAWPRWPVPPCCAHVNCFPGKLRTREKPSLEAPPVTRARKWRNGYARNSTMLGVDTSSMPGDTMNFALSAGAIATGIASHCT